LERQFALKNSSSLPFFFISQRLKRREIVLGGFLSKKKTKLENLERERGGGVGSIETRARKTNLEER
jgi:hypothetical protein